MKTFNLQEALAGKPVITRTGLKVTQLHLFEHTGPYTLVGVIDGEPEEVDTWTEDGRFATSMDSGNDLFMATTKVCGFINIFKRDEGNVRGKTLNNTTDVLPTLEDAQEHAGAFGDRLVAVGVPVEWEE